MSTPTALRFALACVLSLASLRFGHAQDVLPGFKPPPERPPVGASVIVEDQEVLEECDPESVCIEGNLFNEGSKTAYKLKLKVEVGGGKYAKPRTSFFSPLEHSTLDAGARMGFSVTVKRKIPYKDRNGEEKSIDAGKYNIKLVPVWSAEKKLTGTRASKKK